MDWSTLKTDAAGLVTVVVQDKHTGEVRMVAHANPEALQLTTQTGDAHFWSRSRKALWRKGESSGNTMAVAEVWVDCDADAVIYLVDPHGPTCHTGAATCFFKRVAPAGTGAPSASPTLARLWTELEARRASTATTSYTRQLLDAGTPKIVAKIREEAEELSRALEQESDERVVSEAADVVYHVLVGLLARGVSLRDVEAELARRSGVSGIAEKEGRG